MIQEKPIVDRGNLFTLPRKDFFLLGIFPPKGPGNLGKIEPEWP